MSNRLAIYLNGSAALVVCMAGIGWNAARAQQSVPPPPAKSATGSASGISLDIVGIKLGMSVKDAMLALKADNPRLTLTPSTLQLEGFVEQLMPSVRGRDGTEDVEITFTMAPSQEGVWGVKRIYSFAAAERPSLQNTLDALHKKYGAETVAPDPDPRNATKTISWVYDAQGRPMGPGGAQLNTSCDTLLLGNFGGEPQSALNDIRSGKPWPPQCNSIIIVNASVQATRDPASSQLVVFNLIVSLADGGRYRSGIGATRAVVLGAVQSREKKQGGEVNKRGAPKL